MLQPQGRSSREGAPHHPMKPSCHAESNARFMKPQGERAKDSSCIFHGLNCINSMQCINCDWILPQKRDRQAEEMKKWDRFIQVNRACWKSPSGAIRSSQNNMAWSLGNSSLPTWEGSQTPRTGGGHTSYLLGKMDGWEGRDCLIRNASGTARLVQKVNRHRGITETAQNGVRQGKKKALLENPVQGVVLQRWYSPWQSPQQVHVCFPSVHF